MSQSRNINPGSSSMSESMENTASTGPEAAGVHGSIEGVTQRLRDTAGQAREFVSEKLNTVTDQLSHVGDQVSQGMDRIRTMEKSDYDELWTGVKEKARENPGQTILIAAGVGFVCGLMLRMGSRR